MQMAAVLVTFWKGLQYRDIEKLGKPGFLYKVNSTQKTTCDFEVEISETSLCPKRPVFLMVAGVDGIYMFEYIYNYIHMM